jgi:hypothetical protein
MTQQEYFDFTVKKVLKSIECTLGNRVNFEMIDFETESDSKLKNHGLGYCQNNNDNTYSIKIDEFFVSECYKYFVLDQFWSTWELVGETLEKVICHELAHIQEWNHSKKHTELTNRLINKVELPKKYYSYLDKKLAL